MQATLTNEGEVVIPRCLLERYGLHSGTTVILEPREGEIALRPVEARSRAFLVRFEDDVLLAASPEAPRMTPELVKRMLNDWP